MVLHGHISIQCHTSLRTFREMFFLTKEKWAKIQNPLSQRRWTWNKFSCKQLPQPQLRETKSVDRERVYLLHTFKHPNRKNIPKYPNCGVKDRMGTAGQAAPISR
ncbi:unnamed protein product [Gulo gulo]|uniref:Uncharacterized protein n=1 Tax=Gulo gulo TaxID=48420 RepID=A0A9X9LZI7_GULGU|nr:unnamed protein product [Gulo gulo]